jgi:transcriptional regulator with XRE-family HTH domain
MSGAVRIARSISAAQCREARAILGWRREQLATYSSVAMRTILDFERGARAPRARTLTALSQCFETAGVILVAENGDGRRQPPTSRRPF